MSEKDERAIEILLYLCGVAQNTAGAEVWRALFGEIISRIQDGTFKEKRG